METHGHFLEKFESFEIFLIDIFLEKYTIFRLSGLESPKKIEKVPLFVNLVLPTFVFLVHIYKKFLVRSEHFEFQKIFQKIFNFCKWYVQILQYFKILEHFQMLVRIRQMSSICLHYYFANFFRFKYLNFI